MACHKEDPCRTSRQGTPFNSLSSSAFGHQYYFRLMEIGNQYIKSQGLGLEWLVVIPKLKELGRGGFGEGLELWGPVWNWEVP